MYLPIALAALTILAIPTACAGAQGEGLGQESDAQAPAEKPATTEVQVGPYPGAPVEDAAGNQWFSTVTAGVVRYDGQEYKNFTTEHGLAGDIVRGIVVGDQGSLWMATNGGVSIFDGKTFTTITDYGDIKITKTFTEDGDHRDIWDILRDRQGTWWIATLAGLFRYDGKAFVPFPLPVIASKGAFEFTPKMVYSIFEAQDGALWFATDGAGAVRYDGSEMKVYTQQSHGLCSDRICTILQDRRGDFWFGTSDGGVSRYDGRAFTTHFRSAEFSKHTGWGRFMAICEDRQGQVWFGVSSQGGGVHRFDGKEFRYFTEADGLGTGGVPSIREDSKGHLWFGTTSGVYRLDGERFINFTRKG